MLNVILTLNKFCEAFKSILRSKVYSTKDPSEPYLSFMFSAHQKICDLKKDDLF